MAAKEVKCPTSVFGNIAANAPFRIDAEGSHWRVGDFVDAREHDGERYTGRIRLCRTIDIVEAGPESVSLMMVGLR
jgi:hypothetical protein